MMRVVPMAVLALVSSLAWGPSPVAHAFSDPERFTTPADEGGAGGRFFTGSRSDGYTCAVCHSGGSAPEVTVRGLPTSGYEPGELYEVELRFRNADGNHALALELLDAAGRSLELELLSEAQIDVSERCGAEEKERRASYLAKEDDRWVLGVEACEAEAVRFRFRAPNKSQTLFVASVLASDNSATIEGDGVTEVAQTFYRDGHHESGSSGSCTANPRGRNLDPAWLLGACALGMLAIRRTFYGRRSAARRR